MYRRPRRALLLAAAAGHLGLVAAGALDLCLWELGPVGPALTVYSALSGADSGYSYFAPGVASPLHARFTIIGADGRAVVDRLEGEATREGQIRVEDLIEVIDHRRADRATRAAIARSWAAALLARHRGAERVIVDVGRERVPSMAATRRGERPRWRSAYRAQVRRAAPRPGGGS